MHPLHGPKPVPVSDLYNYSFEFPFETAFSAVYWTRWFADYWINSIVISLAYVLVIFLGEKFMRDRAAFDLKKALTVWNFAAALFSILGAIRMTPEFFHVLRNYGFRYSICTSGYTQLRVTGFWATVFTLSKALELIDTAFIVLRKRPVIFLHWYHHVTVMLLTWYGFKDHPSPARWFIWMNYSVHGVMYTYYGVRAIGWRTAKWISVTVTTMQISQMLVGCYIAYDIYTAKAHGEFCQQTPIHLRFTIIVYFSYLILFVQFFYEAYLKRGRGRAKKAMATTNGEESAAVTNGLATKQKRETQNGLANNNENHKTK